MAANASKALEWECQSRNSRHDSSPICPGSLESPFQATSSRSCWGNGRCLSRTQYIRLKREVLIPIPSERRRAAKRKNLGWRMEVRVACEKSSKILAEARMSLPAYWRQDPSVKATPL